MFRPLLLHVGICLVLAISNVNAVDPTGTIPSMGMPGMPGGPGGMPGGPGMQPRQRDARQPVANDAAAAAEQDISTKLNALLANINQGKEPDAAELKDISDSVRKNMQYLQRMDAKGQANLQLLNAWMNYFVGKLKLAKIAANNAYKADPQNKDAQATLVVMAIASNDIRTAKTTIKLLQKKAAKPAEAGRQNTPYGAAGESPAVLNFDPNSVKTEFLDEKIGAFDAACLNGTSFPFKGGKTLIMLLWANAAAGAKPAAEGSAPAPPMRGMPGMPGMMPGAGYQSGQTLSPIETFASLFAKEYQNDKVAFLGLNLNDTSESGEVMATLMKNTWPWPQAMALDSRNAALASLAKLRSDKPSLVIVGGDGAIKYAGELSGLVLQVMAAHAQSGSELTIPAEKVPTASAAPSENVTEKTTESNSVPPTPDTNTAARPANANTPPAASIPQPRAQKSSEETFNPQAQDLYNTAVQFMKMPGSLSMGRAVDNCHQILQQYPDAPEAEKARQLLRKVPASKRSYYHVTSEDLGQ